MVVVSVVLSMWIVLVWWQDRRMERTYGARVAPDDASLVKEALPRVDEEIGGEPTSEVQTVGSEALRPHSAK